MGVHVPLHADRQLGVYGSVHCMCISMGRKETFKDNKSDALRQNFLCFGSTGECISNLFICVYCDSSVQELKAVFSENMSGIVDTLKGREREEEPGTRHSKIR